MRTQKSMKFCGVFAGAVLAAGLTTTSAFAGVLYTDIPSTDTNGGPETTSVSSYVYNPSNPYGSAGGAFGSLIDPTASGTANAATVVLSNYDPAAQNNVSLTFNLYAVTGAGTTGSIGAGQGDQLYTIGTDTSATPTDSVTQTFNIPGNGSAPPGQLYYANFNLNNDPLTAGQQYIWQVVVNSAADGLNFAVNNWNGSDDSCASANPICTAGNPQYNTAYLTGGVANDSGGGWASIGQGEASFSGPSSGVPEPATLGLIGLGLLGIGASVRRKSRKL